VEGVEGVEGGVVRVVAIAHSVSIAEGARAIAEDVPLLASATSEIKGRVELVSAAPQVDVLLRAGLESFT
jgi:hypothetical protein